MSPTSTPVKPRVTVDAPRRSYAPPRPRRDVPSSQPRTTRTAPRRHVPGRLGSRQVVSVRGRRIQARQPDQRTWRLVTLAFVVLIAGVGLAMYLSGLAAQQTFQLKDLQTQEANLDNRIESLSRDVEDAESTGGLIDVARQDRLEVPEQAGILMATDDGVVEDRPARGETRALVDVNGDGDRRVASSDPERTRQVSDKLAATPRAEERRDADADQVPAPAAPPPGLGFSPAPYPSVAGR